jgi:V/A-type H+-transporting ATPase subunit F
MDNNTIAAVGDRASVLVFHTAGVTTRSVNNSEDAAKAIKELAVMGYKIIYLNENYYLSLSDLMEKYRENAYPAIIPIPDRSGTKGVGYDKIIANMEKAIGTNIFDK